MRLLVSHDSPLVNLPNALEPEHRVWLDMVAQHASIADLALMRLRGALERLSPSDALPRETQHLAKVSAVSDCWQFVDSCHRLKGLFGSIPRGMRSPSTEEERTGYQVFKELLKQLDDALRDVRALRNAFQHANDPSRVADLAGASQTAWGQLSWLHVPTAEWPIYSYVWAVGTIGVEVKIDWIPLGNGPRSGPIDNIQLLNRGARLDFTTAFDAVAAVVGRVEAAVGRIKGKVAPRDPIIMGPMYPGPSEYFEALEKEQGHVEEGS